MKKLLLPILLISAIWLVWDGGAIAQEPEQGDFAGVAFGSIWTDPNFTSPGGGGKVGIQTRIDEEKGIWVRTIYTQFSVSGQDEPVETVQGAGLVTYYLGKKLWLYFLTGVDAYLDGPNTNASFYTGVGASRRVWTGSVAEGIPASLSLFGEITFTDADEQPTGSFVQLNIGLAFDRGK